MNKTFLIILSLAIVSCLFSIESCTHQPYVMPNDQRTTAAGICFETDVLPIFQSNCAKSGCHDAVSHEEGYNLTSYSNIMKRGIVPGNPAASEIYESITLKKGDEFMPKGGPALSAAQINTIKAWIVAGAMQGGSCNTGLCDSSNVTYTAVIAPIVQTYCIGCHTTPSSPEGSLATYAYVKEATINGNLIATISHLPGYSAMPQGGTKLDDCKIALFKKWVANGAPEN